MRYDSPMADAAQEETEWTVYVLRSRTLGRTYVGIALDADLRLSQHNGEAPGGAKSTRAGRPWTIAKRYGPFATRSQAQRAEAAVKALRGKQRVLWDPSSLD